ncbi:MAG: PAS domain S-box protein [Anaerolineae bacterium]|nr:PAS domain S-box protein [Anaerolineae bacterium]
MVEERTVELRRAKEQIEIILNNTRDAIALAKANGDIETRNPAFIAMFGEHVSNWIELLLWTVTTDEQATTVSKALLNTIQNQEGQRIELQIVSENGGDKDIDLAFIPVRLTNTQERSGVLVSAHDITHIKQIERFKTRFIDDAMHDLATPIAGLTNRLYLMKRSPEKLDEHLHKLENQVSHLRNLLDDLRSLAQLDRGQLALNLERYDINLIVGRVFDTYEPVAISKGQLLDLDMAPNLPTIEVDARQIERVFVNLVANAVNYTPNDRSIRVQTGIEDDHIIFSVKDEGMGISPEDLPHIFERFYRATVARSSQSTGTGLGLAIVKEIVERHGGSVTAYSELGKGSTFTVRLPIQR